MWFRPCIAGQILSERYVVRGPRAADHGYGRDATSDLSCARMTQIQEKIQKKYRGKSEAFESSRWRAKYNINNYGRALVVSMKINLTLDLLPFSFTIVRVTPGFMNSTYLKFAEDSRFQFARSRPATTHALNLTTEFGFKLYRKLCTICDII